VFPGQHETPGRSGVSQQKVADMSYAGGGVAILPIALPRNIADDALPCRRADPELFFAEAPADVEEAKALCLDCPIREICLAGALQRREPWGVWGGELFVQGVVVAHKRPRGRPRKHPLPELAPAVESTTAREVAA
jgi:WhiB family transcriptional regulator, redox-sensing transcriptional regulator